MFETLVLDRNGERLDFSRVRKALPSSFTVRQLYRMLPCYSTQCVNWRPHRSTRGGAGSVIGGIGLPCRVTKLSNATVRSTIQYYESFPTPPTTTETSECVQNLVQQTSGQFVNVYANTVMNLKYVALAPHSPMECLEAPKAVLQVRIAYFFGKNHFMVERGHP